MQSPDPNYENIRIRAMQQAFRQEQAAKGKRVFTPTASQAAAIYNYGSASPNRTKKVAQGKQDRKSRRVSARRRRRSLTRRRH